MCIHENYFVPDGMPLVLPDIGITVCVIKQEMIQVGFANRLATFLPSATLIGKIFAGDLDQTFLIDIGKLKLYYN